MAVYQPMAGIKKLAFN